MDNVQGFSRRDLVGMGAIIAVPGAVAACVSPPAPQEPDGDLRLVFQPARIFKTADLPREGTEAWFASAVVESRRAFAPDVEMVEVTHLSKGRQVSILRYDGEAAQSIVVLAPSGAAATPTGAYRLLGIRLTGRERAALDVDAVALVIRLREGGRAREVRGSFSVQTYAQTVSLIFPFKGQGIVTQGGAANGGHRNRSGQFAIDAMGLSASYAVQTGAAFAANTDLSGFGRELIAPAAGVVVVASGDRPDQPTPGVSDEAFHRPEFRGSGDPGNHAVIDHGHGEFSMIAHMKAGSLLVSAGQKVAQGEPIGQLGNSGDSFAPHIHYQLQDGADWQTASGLPCRFSNLDAYPLVRGEFFRAR